MGFWSFLIGGYTASVLNNKLNPPTIIAPDGYEVRGIKPKGTSGYVVTYAKKGSHSSADGTFFVNRKTIDVGIGGNRFRVYW